MSNQEYAEDEINLRDYLNVIIKRKKIILSVFFIAVITAIIASFLMPQVYEVSSKVQIGRIDELLMKKEEAKEMLLGQSLLAPIIKELNLDIEPSSLKKSIEIEDIKDTDLLKIKVQYPDADMVVKINKAIANSFISYSQTIYQERAFLVNERLKELETELNSIEEDKRKTQNLTADFPSSGISSQELSLRIILLQNTLSNYESHLSLLKNQRNNMKILLAKSKDFKIVDSPIEPKYPIKPKKKLNVAIAGIVSLMVGIFLVFFAEYWEKSKQTSNIKP